MPSFLFESPVLVWWPAARPWPPAHRARSSTWPRHPPSSRAGPTSVARTSARRRPASVSVRRRGSWSWSSADRVDRGLQRPAVDADEQHERRRATSQDDVEDEPDSRSPAGRGRGRAASTTATACGCARRRGPPGRRGSPRPSAISLELAGRPRPPRTCGARTRRASDGRDRRRSCGPCGGLARHPLEGAGVPRVAGRCGGPMFGCATTLNRKTRTPRAMMNAPIVSTRFQQSQPMPRGTR